MVPLAKPTKNGIAMRATVPPRPCIGLKSARNIEKRAIPRNSLRPRAHKIPKISKRSKRSDFACPLFRNSEMFETFPRLYLSLLCPSLSFFYLLPVPYYYVSQYSPKGEARFVASVVLHEHDQDNDDQRHGWPEAAAAQFPFLRITIKHHA